ncbi:hypothetical protein LINPERPRIM_LOCUS13908 [Linum perenne]
MKSKRCRRLARREGGKEKAATKVGVQSATMVLKIQIKNTGASKLQQQ